MLFTSVFDFTPSEGAPRGRRFHDRALADILRIWGDALAGEPIHSPFDVILPTKGGGWVEITTASIRWSREAETPDNMRAAALHMAQQWRGLAGISYDPENPPTRKQRIQQHAYAQAYGVELHDPGQGNPRHAFTAEDWSKVEALQADIRRRDPAAAAAPAPVRAPVYECDRPAIRKKAPAEPMPAGAA